MDGMTIKRKIYSYLLIPFYILVGVLIVIYIMKYNEAQKSFFITNKEISLSLGNNEQIILKIEDKEYQNIANPEVVVWGSSDESIAMVDQNGVVTGLGKGMAEITVRSESGKIATTLVEVFSDEEVVTTFSLNKSSAELDIGDSLELIPDIDTNDINNTTVTWLTSNKNVATVDNGIVSAKGSGKATIVAKLNDGSNASCTIIVRDEKQDSSTITFSNTNMNAKVGARLRLTPNIVAPNNEITELSWLSSDESIATVDNSGNVNVLNSGTVDVTVLANNGKSATATIVVTDDAVVPNNITFTTTNVELNIGDTFLINYSLEPANAANVIMWSSNNKAVATVNDGVIIAKGDGTATISAVLRNGKTASCYVTVKKADVNQFAIDKTYLSLKVNHTEKLNVVNGNNVRFTSSNEGIVTVDQDGNVKGISKGSATISAVNGDGKIATCNIDVTGSIGNVDILYLSESEKEVYVGEEFILTLASLSGSTNFGNVVWVSSDPNVATVTDGSVKANKTGQAVIKAITSSGKEATCTVTVKNKYVDIKSISIDKEDINLDLGSSLILHVTFDPINASDKSITWTSSNDDVVSVVNGIINAKGEGQATVVATAKNGLKAQCNVTVTKNSIPATSVSLSQKEVNLVVNESITLNAVISPADATNQNITWSSSNSNIASVNNGYVVAHKAGTVRIIATTSNGKQDSCLINIANSDIAVSSISLNNKENMYVGDNLTLKADIKPDNASNKNVTWSSSDSSIATVNNGVVTALKEGSVVITAQAHNGKTASCAITITTRYVDVSSVVLNQTNATIKTGDTISLTSTINPANATNKNVTWSSSNSSVATVDNNGNVKAVSEGNATITVTTNNGKQATCSVYVNNNIVDVTSISLNKTTATVEAGDKISLTATVAPSNATNKNITWTSSNSSIATVDKNGNVTTKAAGNVVISATASNGKQATCALTVNAKIINASSVSLSKSSANMYVGDKLALKATINPSNTTNKTISWSSSNNNIATVDKNGNVKAIGTGTVTITATTNNGKQATCKIIITNKTINVSSISLDKTKVSMYVGNSTKLTAKINPDNATNKNVTWASNNKSVATVDKNGNVKAVKIGSATITATSSNGLKASCVITVTNNNVDATSISISNPSINLSVGKQDTVLATIAPSNATNKNITWTTSNKNVVTVDGKGNIKGINPGTATITAKTHNGKTATANVTVTSEKVFVVNSANDSQLIVANYNVLDYGADPSGAKDSTAAFKAAIAEANNCVNQPTCYGYTVYVPKGRYLIKESLELGPTVGLIGELKEGTTDGTILMIDFAAGSDNINNSAIRMGTQSAVMNIAFWYPNQSANANGYTTVYPATITQIGNYGITIKNVYFVNSFVAMDFASHHFDLSLQQITNIYGAPFRGIVSDGNFDTIRITNLNFSPDYWINSGLSNPGADNVKAALKNRGEGLIFERIDWFFLAGIRIDNYNVGIHMRNSLHHTKDRQSVLTPNGEMYDVHITNANYSIYVQNARPFTLTIATLTSTNPNIGTLHIENSDLISINSAIITGPKAIFNGGGGSISTTNSVITGTIQRNNSGAKLSFTNDALTNTGFDGSQTNDDIGKGPTPVDYNKNVVTKPASTEIVTINAAKGSDITNDIRNAINKLKDTGGIVYIPAGNYVVSDHIDVLPGIEIRGTTPWFHNWNQDNLSGQWIEHTTRIATAYKGDVLFTLYSNSGINGLSIIYADQNITEYPFTIRGNGSNIYIKNIAMPNSWQGIDLATYRCDNHYVDGVYGQFYKMGIKVGGGSYNGIVKNCHVQINTIYLLFTLNGKDTSTFYNHWKYLVNNETAYELGYSTNELFFDNFVYNSKIGFNITNGSSNFTLLACGADAVSWVSHHVSGGVTGQIVNNIMEPMAGDNHYCYRYNGSDCFLAGNNVSDRRYLKFGESYSGFVNVVNPIGWGNGSDSTAFDFNGEGDIHVVGGIIYDTASPAIKVNVNALSIYGLIINRTPNPVYDITSKPKGVYIVGNVCSHGTCSSYMKKNTSIGIPDDSRGVK